MRSYKLLYQFFCHIISNDNVKSRLKSYLTINHFLDLSMHNYPFVLSHNHKCAYDNYHCIKGPRDIIAFTQSKRDKYYFDNLTALCNKLCMSTTYLYSTLLRYAFDNRTNIHNLL